MSSEEEDLAATAWPGFVDILSSVIIVFVFFVMIVAAALFFYMMIFKSKIEANTEAVANKRVNVEIADVVTEKAKLESKIHALEEQIADLQINVEQGGSELSQSSKQEVLVDGAKMTLEFDESAITVTEDSLKEIEAFVSGYAVGRDLSSVNVQITVGKNPDAKVEGVSRKIAVARLFNVRNSILENNIPKGNVKGEVRAGEKNSYGWVRIELSEKK